MRTLTFAQKTLQPRSRRLSLRSSTRRLGVTTILLITGLLLAANLSIARAALQVGYPSSPLIQCGGPSQLQWSGQQGQVAVFVVDQHNSVYADFGQQPADTNSLTWYPVNVTAGTKLQVVVFDDTGTMAKSPELTVQGSNDKSCLSNKSGQPSFTLFGGSSSSSAKPTSSPASPASPTSSSPDASTTPAPTSGSDVSSPGTSNPSSVPTSTSASTSGSAAATNAGSRAASLRDSLLPLAVALGTLILSLSTI